MRVALFLWISYADSAPLLSSETVTILSGENVTDLSASLPLVLTNTTSLTIVDTNISRIDAALLGEHLPRLQKLIVEGNAHLQEVVGRFNFSELSLSVFNDNNLSAFPSFSYCPQLTRYIVETNGVPLPRLDASSLVQCAKLKNVTLTDCGLEDVPRFNELQSADLEVIDLATNRISSFSNEHIHGLNNIKRIRLEDNSLVTFPVLENLTSLVELNICDNPMKNVTIDTFYHLTSLGVLKLCGSALLDAPPDVSLFPQIVKVEFDFDQGSAVHVPVDYLNSSNGLRFIILRKAHFESLPPPLAVRHSVEGLVLGTSTVTHINESSFEGFDQLHYLYLGHVGLSAMPSLETLKSTLKTLKLPYNNIGAIPPGYFTGFVKLSLVKLDFNHIQRVPNLGQGITITRLNLQGNEIKSIDADAFSGFCCLTFVDLNKNQLLSMSFYTPPTLETLNLEGNEIPVICEKDLLPKISLTSLRLRDNPLACTRSTVCLVQGRRWGSVINLDPLSCDSQGQSAADAAREFLCADATCDDVPDAPNATSETLASDVIYSCAPGLRFADGSSRVRAACRDARDALHRDAALIRRGCAENVPTKRRELMQTGENEYVDQSAPPPFGNIEEREIEMKKPLTLDCARLCNRTNGCVKFVTVETPGDEIYGTCKMFVETKQVSQC